MPKTKDAETQAFEAALMRSVDQAVSGQGRVTSAVEIKARRGRPPQETHKEPVTLRMDPQAVAQWRATGKGWQTRAAKLLDDWAKAHVGSP